MIKYKEYAVVCSQEQIAADIYSLWIQTEEIARAAGPGQFLSVYTGDGTKLLPRPISICEIDREQGRLRLVYRVTGPGTGTEQFSRLKPGDQVEVMGPAGERLPQRPYRDTVPGGWRHWDPAYAGAGQRASRR